MPISIATLPVVDLDYTQGGPGVLPGLTQLRTMLEGAGGRAGYVLVNVHVPGVVLPVVMARDDLYIMGFESGGTWYRFDDAVWPFTEAVTSLGHDGQYATLGGLAGQLTLGSIGSIAKLANPVHRHQWKEALRTLLIVVSECSRLIPVQMQILGLLNGYWADGVRIEGMQHYIQNWSRASRGTDMSQQVAPNLWVGFNDPTIIRR